MEPITVIGAGNGGCALAADLTERGFDVLLYADPAHSGRLDGIQSAGAITASGEIRGRFQVKTLTKDLNVAIPHAKYILVALPSNAHDSFFTQMIPLLQDGQVIVLLNGNMGGFACLAQLNALSRNTRVVLVESNALPYACRAASNGNVRFLGIKNRISVGTFPASLSQKAKAKIGLLFRCQLEWCADLLEVGLQANNGVIHPPAAILNVGRMESTKGKFYFYKDGISPAVAKVVEAIDGERLEIARRYGFNLRSLLDEFAVFYGDTYASIADFATNTKLHNLIKEAPSRVDHRYITEDVPYILVPWYLLGKLVGYEAQTMGCIIKLGSVMNNIQSFECGRNLQQMGVSGLGPVQILKHIHS